MTRRQELAISHMLPLLTDQEVSRLAQNMYARVKGRGKPIAKARVKQLSLV